MGAIVLYKRCGLVAIEANMMGKITTVIQITFVAWLFYFCFLQKTPDIRIYNGFLFVMSLSMIISFAQYSFIWISRLKKRVSE